MNTATVIGRAGQDAEIRYFESGKAKATFSLAVNRWDSKSKENVTDWFNIEVWDKQAQFAGDFVKKGREVAVDGRIQTGSYDDKDGKKVYTTDIVADRVQFLESKGSSNVNAVSEDNVSPADFQSSPVETNVSDDVFADFGSSIEISDDDIAF